MIACSSAGWGLTGKKKHLCRSQPGFLAVNKSNINSALKANIILSYAIKSAAST